LVRWLTHTGREVSPSGLKADAGASGKKRVGGGARVRWLTHTGREVSPSGLEDRCWRIGKGLIGFSPEGGIGIAGVRKPPDREPASLLLSPEGDT
jgi:hypothetical protein